MGNESKTWQRTKTPGLLRHRTGRYYARFSASGKTWFEALKTDVAEVAKIRFSEAKLRVVKTRKTKRKISDGIAKMGDLALLMRQRIDQRTGVSEKTKELNRQALAFLEKTWTDFASVLPKNVTPLAVIEWRENAIKTGSGFRPPGSKKTSVKGASASTVNKAIDMLRHLLDIAVDTSAIPGNPLLGRRKLKAPNKPKKPNLPEARTLEAVFNEMGSIGGRGISTAEFCRGLAYTGCRKAEAAGLTWGDIDQSRGVIRVAGTKTESAEREVPLIPAAITLTSPLKLHTSIVSCPFDNTALKFSLQR